MAIFRIIADAEFEADDIDHAFLKLSAYFKGLADDGLEVESLWREGSCEIFADK